VMHDGLLSISRSTAKRIMGGTYLSAVASQPTTGRLYLGSGTGIEVLQKEKEQYFLRRDLAPIGEEVYASSQHRVGTLRASARCGKIYYVEIDGYEARLQEYVYSNPGVVGQIMFARLRGHVHMLGRTGFYAPEVIGGEHRLRYYPYNSEYGSEGKSDTLLAATSVDDKLWQVFTVRIEIVENCSKGCDTTVPAV